MKTAHLETIDRPTAAADVPMQPASWDIWDKKYRLKTKEGHPIDETTDGTYQRVAMALANVEDSAELRDFWYGKFLWALRHGAIPAGRIISNAGALATSRQLRPSTVPFQARYAIRWMIFCAKCMKRA
jgi:ribonucleoside-diphosphate reductase alpha chain